MIKLSKDKLKALLKEGFFDEGDNEALQNLQGKMANFMGSLKHQLEYKFKRLHDEGHMDDAEIEQLGEILRQANVLYRRLEQVKRHNKYFLK